jgi:acetyl-CoA carboxylase biotin carboxylase subunit
MFNKILIANRGEIACRIIRACREMHIKTVAVYSGADTRALHVRMADEAVSIGPPPSRESYLRDDKIIAAAQQTGCAAIHPGYGFLAENADFADAVTRAGLVFIGPPASAMRAMGSKTSGRASAILAGVPVVPALELGDRKPTNDERRILVEQIGYPVLVKAIAGGGGKGMRLVRTESGLDDAIDSARREAINAFGDDRVFIEKFVEHPRHIEIQILADTYGNVTALGERECSIQRRHQKIVEESPSPFLTKDLRARMCDAAVKLAKSVGYINAGTMEFLVDAERNFYFLEMNTRLQVEHPVTEFVTGVDLVKLQIEIANRNELSRILKVETLPHHAIECRVCAEDAENNFLPSIGRITRWIEPRDVRVDAGYAVGDEVTVYYDSLLAKVIVCAGSRTDAIRRMIHALSQLVIEGVTTNIDFLRFVVAHPAFASGDTTTDFVERHLLISADGERINGWSAGGSAGGEQKSELREVNSADGERINGWSAGGSAGGEQKSELQEVNSADGERINGWRNPWREKNRFRVGDSTALPSSKPLPIVGRRSSATTRSSASQNHIEAPMPGVIRDVSVKEGDEVKRGAMLIIMEAMKMEMQLVAPRDGRVSRLNCAVGQVVEKGRVLVAFSESVDG